MNMKKKATERVKKFAGNVKTAKPVTDGLATANDFWTDYETGFVTISKDRLLEIQSLDPGDFLIILDTPFVKMLNDKGVDVTDSEAVTQAVNDLTDSEKMEVYKQNIRKVICAGVVSVKFVDKLPQYCDPEKEVSVDRLSQDDQTIIYNAIKELSVPEEVAEKASSFPDESGDSEGRADTDIPDSKDIPFETVPTIISTN
jgi:hypothetical protein